MIQNKPSIKLQLSKNLTKTIKRGHAWVFADALRSLPSAPAGSPAILLDNRGAREIARGYFDPNAAIAFRVCSTKVGEPLNSDWADRNLNQAILRRQHLFNEPNTTAFRLINGEGDQLPGIICDLYESHAVLKVDGEGPEGFWALEEIAVWLKNKLGLEDVVIRPKNRNMGAARSLFQSARLPIISFKENGVHFTADILEGQKTGFFLDQRDNRQSIRYLSENRRVLNVFGYTGGFSVYAGLGGANHVTTVDLSKPALEMANAHWSLNQLAPPKHKSVAADAFDFLTTETKLQHSWDLVILDPPSFAPSAESVPAAVKAYTRLIALGAAVTSPGGLIALASCSSHIPMEMFTNLCIEGVSQARRQATLLRTLGQPEDHPSPLVMPELQYLKFVLLQLD